ncbi:hypothetical protein [Flavobacterium sp. H122]|uniref:hypothetical protein n=1 Tax=Flavobacterium sp. H122 TaxID=2529860 RepID=UPI0010AAB1AC|nr:hypothetical protein [Flavobacterium sp. H122]
MKKTAVIVVLLISMISFGQSLNDYNMAIIPAKFSFQKSDNEYRVNATVKAFLKEKGFVAYLSTDNLPEGFLDYKCNKIYVDGVEENTMFVTKIKFVFKDCYGTVLFSTDLGESREKEYAVSYNLAAIQALKTFEKAKYKYSGKTYFDEEAQEKLKKIDKVEVAEVKVLTQKNELFYKITDKLSSTELTLYRTSKPDLFLTTFKGRNGIVLYKESTWFFEFVDGEKVVSEKLDIKF